MFTGAISSVLHLTHRMVGPERIELSQTANRAVILPLNQGPIKLTPLAYQCMLMRAKTDLHLTTTKTVRVL